ncbi:hypothetical protein COW80_02335 [Candidatus Beckwithbacteria bacterium CG22_combo_CG10-13_8_21_14_all_01_47_9]|uniref:Hydrolase n=4 Tax=Candidatus Beckwithiibacteriota TaxID=1752726 RepID=A0A2H0E1J2_9BACT|nr:MAG: hypothetical protein AUJ59_02665 [Candidatus Beckwithbacteria bacterium CG1_02_47_37]PIP88101.1 MAG: hypothetical protein COW80_02335 [Candidatus Beckwithbacteria bacterium CG22_combo_CG10-13_8_21_14_all_01_47_9]PJA23134.1 MAG: hypothetical protein COX59_01255 [Candidatus Beckwithbacteria bacterium CG_4_10_14_0_2_um_filter_47_25]PJC66759.1 MAG: hypothetical protein CO018_00185 [Candidatus Beckwithbacteria bacterium CG_4_9_14_0_2_um_filter_47_11]
MDNKAFIFDLDGVIIDSETWWDKIEGALPGHSLGQSINSAFHSAQTLDPKLTWEIYFNRLNRWAQKIYRQAPITPAIDDLLTKLIDQHYRLGLVSGSTTRWISLVIARLKSPIPVIISLHDRSEIKPKPAPDGYLTAIKQLKVKPGNTIILEDSQTGIDSAKSAGAFTICLTEHHHKNYHPSDADLYVKNIPELLMYLDSVQV